MLAQLYNCPKCGQVWKVEEYESIDTERDDIEIYLICSNCYSFVEPLKTETGEPLYHALTEEEMFWDSYSIEEE